MLGTKPLTLDLLVSVLNSLSLSLLLLFTLLLKSDAFKALLIFLLLVALLHEPPVCLQTF
jgi:hypothetical protein